MTSRSQAISQASTTEAQKPQKTLKEKEMKGTKGKTNLFFN